MKKTLLFLICIFICQSCFWGGGFPKKINDKYCLCAIDIMDDLSVCYITEERYMIGVVPAKVVAVGYNNEFIIAKQHPKKDKFSMGIDYNVTNYYIIPLTEKGKVNDYYEKNLYGALTLSEFQNKKIELDITELEFTFFNDK